MEKMDREDAIAYLERKKKSVTEENIERVQTDGKVYGDPIIDVGF